MNYSTTGISGRYEMSGNFYVDQISYHKGFNLYPFSLLTENIFGSHTAALAPVREPASEVARCIERVDPFIQRHTGSVCPHCQMVCCINKHSHHEHEDIIYLFAIGEEPPSHRKDIRDSDPCQFLNEQGCSINRRVRPYRCTWYFCSPLLEHIQNVSSAEYRRFIRSLEEITKKRETMLSLFIEVIKKINP